MASKESLTPIKTRTFCAILYPEEDCSHLFALNKLKECGYSFLACDHAYDVFDEYDNCKPELIGTPKKKHTHLYIRFKSPRWRDAVAKELDIAPNYLQACRNTDSTLLYMIHDGYPTKYQYDVEDCYGTLISELKKLLVSESECSRVLNIIDLIDSLPRPCSYKRLLIAVCNNDLYGDFRRMGSGILRLLDEHNTRVDEDF